MVSAGGRRVLVAGGVGIDTIVRVPSLPLAIADSIHVPAVMDYVAHTGNGVALGSRAARSRLACIPERSAARSPASPTGRPSVA